MAGSSSRAWPAPRGTKYNLLALVAVHRRPCWSRSGLARLFGIKIGHTLGIFAGSMTSTATLQAALDVMKNSDPSIGYSIAYPFGVIGPILCIYFMTRQVQPKFPPKAQRFHMGEITLGDELRRPHARAISSRICRPACRSRWSARAIRTSCRRRAIVLALRRRPAGRRRSARMRSLRRQRSSDAWSPAASSRIARRSTTSAFSSARRTWSASRSRNCRCRPAFRRICCMSGATTWTSCRRPI